MIKRRLAGTVVVATLLATFDPIVRTRAEATPSYPFVSESQDRFRSDNEAQQVTLRLSSAGMWVTPRALGSGRWAWRSTLTAHGSPGDPTPSGDANLVAYGDRIELLYGPLVEWFRNRPEGIEHGLEFRGDTPSPVASVDFAIGGRLAPKVSEDGQTLTFRDETGAVVLACVDLRGLDSEGRDVAARWDWIEHEGAAPVLRLTLDRADHAPPLRVISRLVASKKSGDVQALSLGMAEPALVAPPANDLCGGAEVVPADGPFPWLSPIADVSAATITGDPPAPSCQLDVSHSVWYVFTPALAGLYSFSVCADAPTATTLEDTVLAIYSASGSCAGLSQLQGGCDDDSCGPVALQSALTDIDLAAGLSYYIVAWSYGATVPAPGSETLQLRVSRRAPPGPAPANDLCEAAEIIPGNGPFPYLTATTADIGGATTAGDPPTPTCQANLSRSIWYAFTPAMSGRYAFSACADAPTGTTVDDTVLAIYAASAPCAGLLEVAGGCDDDSCASEAAQSVISGVSLTAGTRYYVVAWKYGGAAPTAGNTAIQLRVSLPGAPPNDACTAAATLPLDVPVSGTTAGAQNDTQLPSGSACFGGIGQTASTATGAEVVYRFRAPTGDRYSFRASGYAPSRNLVLYVTPDCPTGGPPAIATACLGASNRSATSAEEVACLPLAAGQMVDLFVDEDAVTSGSAFTVEANRCRLESEPNDLPASAGEPACGIEGAIAPPGDADVYVLGVAEPGARVFAMVDGVAGNSGDFDLRVIDGADTLEYDDLNNDAPFGSVAPNVAGTRLGGATSYLKVSHYSSAAQAEPYRLYSAIEPPSAGATQEVEPNDTPATASTGGNEYYSGRLSGTADQDFFSFSAAAGESIEMGLDLDPTRDNSPFNGSLALVDAAGTTLVAVNDAAGGSSTIPGTGSLMATTPGSPGEAIVYRIRSSGIYFARVAWASGTPGDYLLSVAHDCRVEPPADLEVTQVDTPDPAPGGGTVGYSVTVRNLGPDPASVVTLRDEPPAGARLVSAGATQGFCAGTGPIVCHLGTLDAGGSAQVIIAVSAPTANGSMTNRARVVAATVDPHPANDDSSEATQIGPPPDADGDGVPDALDCAPADAAAWSVPGEATGLSFVAGDATRLVWTAPANPGGSSVRYDVLVSATPASFASATCLASDSLATSATDTDGPGVVRYYLVRAENACGGNLGMTVDGTPRTGASCP